MDQPRIISLSSWGTRILTELGVDRFLVGVSHKCVPPEKAGNLPVLTRPMESNPRLPEDFLFRSRHFPTMLLSPYNIDPEQISTLKPSHIITESLSRICHTPVSEMESLMEQWLGYKVKIIHLSDANIEDVFSSVRAIVHTLGLPESKLGMYDKCRKQLVKTGKKIASKKYQPLVGILMHYVPARFVGRYFSEMIPMVGATPLNWPHDIWIPDPVFAYPVPHKIIVAIPDLNLEEQKKKLKHFSERVLSLWGGTCSINFYPVDGEKFWDKSTEGLLRTLETIGEIVVPDLKNPKWEGSMWSTL